MVSNRRRVGTRAHNPYGALPTVILALFLLAPAWADKPAAPPPPAALTAPAAPSTSTAVAFTTRPLVAGQPETAAVAGPPHIVVETEQLSAEPVWRGQFAEFTFRVRNDGQADLRLRGKGG